MRKHSQELWLVLMVSLGASAIYSILSLARKLTSTQGLAGSVTTINQPLAKTPWLDLVSQLASISLALVPVLLALYFLRMDNIKIGLIPIKKDWIIGISLPLIIGIPGIALYAVALNLGLTSRIVPSSLGDYWWTPVVLLLAALRSGLQEEIIAVAFFAKKLKIIRPEITIISVIILSSLFRASYHLYQGFSAFIGNFVMGLVFGYLFMRTGRVAPLVIAHTIMNTAVFIGFPLVAGFF
ncbi:MAG: CPBP family intramembrane metalloprotease [Aquiluna sp.]|jgi:membrane protease YdiL (CAAX protease family)|nr:CPBP family intramembrane metalloprotease [Aquiluna sp.]|tara:strand:+ start:105 stop:821 length:717 start_codon:yes stop_codon:yes gene_type:complete